MNDIKITIIGGGNLGKAIAEGLLSNQTFVPSNLTITKRNLHLLNDFKTRGVQITDNNSEAIKNASIIILAVKPYNLEGICSEISSELKPDQILVSTASGVDIQTIKASFNSEQQVVRAMPNTAADVQESVTCICGDVDKSAFTKVEELFNNCGTTLKISEDLMEAATVLGACGIAYVLRFMRAMVQGGIQIGFDSKTAEAIVNQTVKGAASLLIEKGNHAEAEIDKVTTPKGCTIAGLNEMEHNGFSSALIKGITTSFEAI
ncbi:MAG: pyrroline-5-carboxylate reductase [Crocinitomicaceae bacterium]